MNITKSGILTRLLTTNSTGNTAPALNARLTFPDGAGLIQFQTSTPQSVLRVVPFGTANDNQTGTLHVYRWVIGESTAGVVTYVPILACVLTFALNARTGVADGLVLATERFADGIAQTSGRGDASGIIIVGGADEITEARIPIVAGTSMMEIVTQVGTATNLNCLVAAS